ncbi:MAG: hypothetical protein J0J01_29110 [Reyranella sp.]|uniref:hypothetical protein n=1 Tax=Reyranella sp. TaxID=1929291 RepID=UPI001AD4DFD1|nr:hypothetical protein [Reyranella sp.]MBN9090993.1 hypothetical protein [Reyranella sp.]
MQRLATVVTPAAGLLAVVAAPAPAQVGPYDEVYERNVGKGPALKFAHDIDALWYRGGALSPLPMQW